MADVAIISTTIVSRTVFGNKRIVIADLHMGDGSQTLAVGGIALTPSTLGLQGIDFLTVEGGALVYKYTYSTVLMGYTSHATPGAAVLLIAATNSTPHETIRVTAIGYGGS